MAPSRIQRTTRSASRPRPGFLARHAGIPLAGLALASLLLIGLNGDQWLADALFRLEGGRWTLRHAWATEQLLHRGGRLLSGLAWLAVVLLWLQACLQPAGVALRRPLLYLWLAVALGSGAVSAAKQLTGVHCPWELARYGGAYGFTGLFDAGSAGSPRGTCFPAGHASAGYAWVALYFAALLHRPRWRRHGLAIGLVAGLVFGIAQQLRGAHFLSHDLWSLATCWLASLALFLWMPKPDTDAPAPAHRDQAAQA